LRIWPKIYGILGLLKIFTKYARISGELGIFYSGSSQYLFAGSLDQSGLLTESLGFLRFFEILSIFRIFEEFCNFWEVLGFQNFWIFWKIENVNGIY
jgi:hypothetical protein